MNTDKIIDQTDIMEAIKSEIEANHKSEKDSDSTSLNQDAMLYIRF